MQLVRNRAALEHVFVGENHFTVALTIGPLQDLEEILDCGVSEIFTKFMQGRWSSKELQHVIRLGLIGGGMDTEAAYDLVNRHVVSGDLLEYVVVATALLQASLAGVKGDPVGEPAQEGEPMPVAETPPAESSGRKSTSSAARRATRSTKSAK